MGFFQGVCVLVQDPETPEETLVAIEEALRRMLEQPGVRRRDPSDKSCVAPVLLQMMRWPMLPSFCG